MGMCPRSKSQGGGAIKKPVNITTTFFSTREYGNVPAIKIHGGGGAIKKPVNITLQCSYLWIWECLGVRDQNPRGGGAIEKPVNMGIKGWNRLFEVTLRKTPVNIEKKGKIVFLEVTFWETPQNFRKYNWILFTKFSCLQFLNGLSGKQI